MIRRWFQPRNESDSLEAFVEHYLDEDFGAWKEGDAEYLWVDLIKDSGGAYAA